MMGLSGCLGNDLMNISAKLFNRATSNEVIYFKEKNWFQHHFKFVKHITGTISHMKSQ